MQSPKLLTMPSSVSRTKFRPVWVGFDRLAGLPKSGHDEVEDR
jgi:hypothetical protein